MFAFSSFMLNYLDPVIKDGQCAQFVDDFAIAANSVTVVSRNFPTLRKCFRQCGLKLTIKKCHFWVRKVQCLGRTISSEGFSPQIYKIQNFFNNLRFRKSKNAVQRYLGFINHYKTIIAKWPKNSTNSCFSKQKRLSIIREKKRNLWYSEESR